MALREPERPSWFKRFRVAFLLLILIGVGAQAFTAKRRVLGWKSPLSIGVFPIAGDTSAEVASYVASLRPDQLQPVAEFLEREAQRRGITTTPLFTVLLGPRIQQLPPAPPSGESVLDVVFWSLGLRWWVWRRLSEANAPKTDIRVFVVYHKQEGQALSESVGLAAGFIGIVNAFGDDKATGPNAVVIAHEVLHTAGASDKYDADGFPLHPSGFAEPARIPLLPQTRAEIMAGRIPIGPGQARIPQSLAECLVGDETASEIGWLVPAR